MIKLILFLLLNQFILFYHINAQYDCSTETVEDYTYGCPAEGLESLSTSANLILNLDASSFNTGDLVWEDQSTSGYDITLPTNTQLPTYGEGNRGTWKRRWFEFDGVDDYMALSGLSYTSSDEIRAITLGAWFSTTYYDATFSASNEQWAWLDFDRSEYFTFTISPNGLITFASSHADTFSSPDPQDTVETGDPLADGTFHYAAITFECTTCTNSDGVKSIYRNGELTISESGFQAIGRGVRTRFGILGDGSESTALDGNRNEFYYEGNISMLHIYDYALSASEISDIYDATKKFYQDCPAGYYCENGIQYECEPGYYCPGDWELHECGGNEFYCPGGISQTSPTDVTDGYYTTGGTSTTRTDETICTPGYYCDGGELTECGGNEFYCPTGSDLPTSVSSGYYTIGGTSTTRTDETICTTGTYCISGVQEDCPAGRYGSTTGLTVSTCTGPCSKGYFCDTHSTSSQQEDCGLDPTPALYYCPSATTERLEAGSNEYTTPETNSEYNRYSTSTCTTAFVCYNGTRDPLIEWDDTVDCSGNGAILSVDEGDATADATPIQTAALNSNDDDGSVIYSLEDNDDNIFIIDVNTGQISLDNIELDAEATINEYYITQVADGGSGILIYCNITIQVNDENDEPIIDVSGTHEVEEDAELNTVIGDAITATDPDDGQSENLLFYITGGNGKGIWSIGGCSGQIFLDKEGFLDYNEKSEYQLIITVKDEGGLSDSANVTITILDVNDPPSFDNSAPEFEVDENSDIGTLVISTITGDSFLAVTDQDVGDTLTWEITRNDDSSFSIDSNTGDISTTVVLDYETKRSYNIEVTVEDSGGETDVIDVDINVLDTNDPPEISYSSLDVDENSAQGKLISSLPLVNDEDTGSNFTYTINDTTNFYISTYTGRIYVNNPSIDYETTTYIPVKITVEDDGLNNDGLNTETGFVRLDITINNVNEAPTVSSDSLTLFENETIGSIIYDVEFTDPEDTGSSTYIFTIDTGSMLAADTGVFGFSDSLSESLSIISELNYEDHPSSYAIIVKVQDSGGLSDTNTITIQLKDSNDNPSLDETIELDVDEIKLGGFTNNLIIATDEDTTAKRFGQLEYTITGGDGASYFNITTINNEGKLQVSTALDYESDDTLTLDIQVEDGGGLTSTTEVTINVIDANDQPQLTNKESVTYQAEYEASTNVIEGDIVTTYIATDDDDEENVDGWGTISYTLLSDSSTTGFTLNSDTGVLTINDQTVIKAPNVFTLEIEASDGGGKTDIGFYYVNISNSNAEPSFTIKNITLFENSGDGNIGNEIIGIDDDGDDLTFSIVKCTTFLGTTCSSRADQFEISAVTTTSAQLSIVNENLNYEDTIFGTGKSQYILQISASDGFLSDEQLVYIKLRDVEEAPVLSNANFAIFEDKKINGFIGTIIATDDDENSILKYSWSSTSDYQTIFNISIDGNITLIGDINYEEQSVYSLTALVTDNDGLTDTATIKITIYNVEESPVINSQNIPIPEDSSLNTGIVTVEATDEDFGDEATLEYSLTNGYNIFDIDIDTGEIKLINSLDYENITLYILEVIVTDETLNTDSANIYINVTDVNDITIDSIYTFNNNNLPINTTGNDIIKFIGTNFGSLDTIKSSQTIITASYSGPDGLIYNAENCEIININTEIKCTTIEGIGSNHIWNITINDPTTNIWSKLSDDTTTYKSPIITNVTGGNNMETSGGTTITITGQYFGPLLDCDNNICTDDEEILSDAVIVKYGSESDQDEYTCDNAILTKDQTEIQCTSTAGVGSILYWQVSIGSKPQSTNWALKSNFYLSNFGYSPPEITDITTNDLLTTSGDEDIIFTGTNFGEFSVSSNISVTYGGSDGLKYKATDCYINDDHIEVICSSTSGIGHDLNFILTVSDQTTGITSSTVSYEPPVIKASSEDDNAISGAGAFDAATSGDERFVILGEEFGPIGDIDPIVRYGPITNTSLYLAEECYVSVEYSKITCFTTEGVGKDLWISVTLGDQQSNIYEADMSYDQPIISSYDVVWEDNINYDGARTHGGQWILINGDNFGRNDQDPIDSVTYGKVGDEFIACNNTDLNNPFCGCYISVDHEQINCTMVPGAGSDLSWIVTIEGQFSTVPTIDYATPIINNITGNGSVNANTGGGEYITLIGTDFASQEFLDSVTYGPGGVEYDAKDCQVINDYKIICKMNSGVGGTLYWQVEIEDQISDLSTVITNYDAPYIISLDENTGETKGGTEHTITGTNFGVQADDTFFKIYFDSVSIAIDGSSKSILNSAETNSWIDEDGIEYIIFTLPEMITEDHYKNVQVYVDHLSIDGVSQISNSIYFEYGDPYIDDVENAEGEVILGITTADLVLQGQNFGSSGTLYIDDVEQTTSSWDHERIELNYVGTEGTIYIVVGDKTSNSVEFNDYSPELYAQSPYIPTGAYSTKGYQGNTDDIITLAGKYFGDEEGKIDVFVGNFNATIVTGTLVDTNLLVDGVTIKSIEAYVPEGYGRNNLVTVSREGKSSYTGSSDNLVYLDYKPPSLDNIETPNNNNGVPTIGGIIKVNGDNFGNDESVIKAYYDNTTELELNHLLISHSKVSFNVSAGQGLVKEFNLFVDNVIDTDHSNTISFAYASPTIDLIDIDTILTVGDTFVVEGSNFGIEGYAEAYLTDLSFNRDYDIDVEITEYDSINHAELTINIGEGQGQHYLAINVSKNIVYERLDFHDPVITNISPTNFSTSGGDLMLIEGNNFGVGNDYTINFISNDLNVVYTYPDSRIISYNQTNIWLYSPEGVSRDNVAVSLTVSDLTSNDDFTISYNGPKIDYLANPDDIDKVYDQNCDRFSSDGCEVGTEGGYDLVLIGKNFGNNEDLVIVYFGQDKITGNDISLTSDDDDDNGHTLLYFTVPAGTGKNISIIASIADQNSSAVYFDYDPPSVTYITPNTPFGGGETLEIHGKNFGETEEDAGNVQVWIGGLECTPVTLAGVEQNIWQIDDGEPYLLCDMPRITVGEKSVKINVVGINRVYDADEGLVEVECTSGYYGESAWQPYLNSDGDCEQECSCAELNCTETNWNGTHWNEYASGCYDLNPCVKTTINSETVYCIALTKEDEYCIECPTGSECDDPSNVYPIEPIALEGYYRVSLDGYPDNQENCDTDREHRHICWEFAPCEPDTACLGNNECDIGYSGEKCTDCCDLEQKKITIVKQYPFTNIEDCEEATDRIKNEECYTDGDTIDGKQLKYYRFNGVCKKCPSNPGLLIGLFIGGFVVAGIIAYYLNKKRVNLGIVSIGIDYFQVISIFANTDVEWPQSIQNLYDAFSAFNFNLNITAPECSFSLSYEEKWYAIEIIPLILLSIIFCIHTWKVIFKFIFKKKRGKKLNSHIHKMIGNSLILMYFFYLFLSTTSLEIFNCIEIESEDGVSDGKEYLAAEPDEVCYEEGSLQMRLLPAAIFFFCLYSIGYPLVLMAILFPPAHRKLAMEDQLLRARGKGYTRDDGNPECYRFRKRYGKLYYQFKPAYFYWILIIICRKFFIATFALLFRKNPTFQLCMILLVMFCAYALQVRHIPYMSNTEREQVVKEYEEVIQFGKDVTDHQHRVGRQSTYAQLRKKNVRLGGNKIERAKAAGTNAANFFFNWNTVESILLMCAVLVNLFGIMFESQFLEPKSAEYESLGNVTITVISLSLIYYSIVIWTEIIAVIFPKLALPCIQQEKGKEDDEEFDESDFEMHENAIAMTPNPMRGQNSNKNMNDGTEKFEMQRILDQQRQEIRNLKQQLSTQHNKGIDTKNKKKRNKKRFDDVTDAQL